MHETVQFGATASEQARIINDCPEDSNHLESAGLSDAKQLDATSDEKAGEGTRTLNIQLGSLATHILSDDETSTYKMDKPSPSECPSSQAQETQFSDPYLTAIELALGELSDVDRNAVARHIKKLAKMSKKRRYAILTLTEEET